MRNCIWMHPAPGEPPAAWQRQLAEMRAAGLDSAMVLVADGERALYDSSVLPVAAPVLEQLLPLAQAEGVALHAWIVALQCNAARILAEHGDWYSVSRRGDSSRDRPPYIDSYRWLCPTRPEVRAYLCALVDELSRFEPLAGVHLDYIRHPDVILPPALQPRYGLVQDRELPEYDFCYCSACRAAFAAQTGRDPLTLDDPAAEADWVRFRCDGIRSLVAAAADRARSRGKKLSAAVFATPSLARRYVRQQWESWDVDAVLPMIYHQYYGQPPAWIPAAVREGTEALRPGVTLHAGLFVGRLAPQELTQAIERSLSAGATGVALFASGSMTAAHWPAVRSACRQPD